MTLLSIRWPVTLGTATTAAVLLGFGLWSMLAQIDSAIIATGRIEVESDRQIVQHPDGGVVAEILVAEGASVRKDQALVRLDGTDLQSELAIVDGQISELMAREARLLAERDGSTELAFPTGLEDRARTSADVAAQLDGQRSLFAARADTLAQESQLLRRRIDQLAAQAIGVTAQSDAVSRQLALVEDDLSAQQGLLDRGLAPAAVVRALQRDAARLQGQSGEAQAELARIAGQITEIEIQIAALGTVRTETAMTELRQIGPVLQELAERRRALMTRIDRLVLRAPVAGLVLGLRVTTPQSVLRAADPVLFIIPQDRPLIVTTRISPLDVDEIAPGQDAELVVSALQSRNTPHLQGKVTRLSADALTDPQTGVAYYTAEVQLAAGEADRLVKGRLLPGMPVEVYFRTGRQTPLAYLIKPFTTYFSRALRES